MRKFKNKKRLLTTFVALAMTFIVGTAFAFTGGLLTLGGTIIIEPDLAVVWYEPAITLSTTADPDEPRDGESSITGGETDAITFTAEFVNAGDTAVIRTRVANQGSIDAVLGGWGYYEGDVWNAQSIAQAINEELPDGFAVVVTQDIAGATVAADSITPDGDGRFTITITLATLGETSEFAPDGYISETFTIYLPFSADLT